MRNWTSAALPLAIIAFAALGPAAAARTFTDDASNNSIVSDDSGAGLECVPYARQVTGIAIHGDAWSWWDRAEGQYARGKRPKVGAVMSFAPHGAMRLGHVAAVSRVVDRRTVLLRHANWSPVNGQRGQIEDGVRAVDVSPANDWSEVRVWFAPTGDLGTTRWPVNGFIYNEPAPLAERPVVLASASLPAALARVPYRSQIGTDFLAGIAPEPAGRAGVRSARPMLSYTAAPVQTKATAPRGARSLADDPIGRIIAARMR